jgi:predicted lipoprotein with Yx(FWY)xxD motif
MNRLLALAAVAAALTVAACGGGGSASTSTPAASSTTVAVKPISGIGDVLVDSAGKALYSSNVEASGKVMCTVASGNPTAAGSAGKLSVLKRPDGTRQVALDGKPLYTFAQDAPGKVQGNGFSDDFGGQHFTWTAVVAGGKSSGSTTTSPPRNDYGY